MIANLDTLLIALYVELTDRIIPRRGFTRSGPGQRPEVLARGWATEGPAAFDAACASGAPRIFRTAELVLTHAASCRFRYSLWTSCGVR